MTRSFVTGVSTSTPSSVTIARSSIRIPAAAGEVDARLDRDDVAGDERVRRTPAEPRRLVHVEPDAVAEPVAEVLAEAARRRSCRARPRRHRRRSRRPDRLDRRELAGEAELVRPRELLVERPGREGAGAVRGVAADDGARVDDDRVAGLDLAVARAVVRQRRVRAAGDDRLEREPLAAVLAEELLEPPRELALRPPDEALLGEGLRRRRS